MKTYRILTRDVENRSAVVSRLCRIYRRAETESLRLHPEAELGVVRRRRFFASEDVDDSLVLADRQRLGLAAVAVVVESPGLEHRVRLIAVTPVTVGGDMDVFVRYPTQWRDDKVATVRVSCQQFVFPRCPALDVMVWLRWV